MTRLRNLHGALGCFALAALLGTAAPALADDSASTGRTATTGSQEDRLATLEREVAALRAELDQKSAPEVSSDDMLGFQLQLRLGFYHQQYNRRNDVFTSQVANENRGWSGGIGLRLPLWLGLAKNLDLIGVLDITYRQDRHAPNYRSAITGRRGTNSYANIVAGPQLRYSVTDMIRPFVQGGFDLQVQTPPTDGVTYLDAGVMLGAGVDFKVHERISFGFDYRFTWMGAGDQECSDYGTGSIYLGFNF